VSHHEQQASKCNGEQQHRELWPAYNANVAPSQASTEGLFQQTQAITQACAFPSPFLVPMSEMRCYTSDQNAVPSPFRASHSCCRRAQRMCIFRSRSSSSCSRSRRFEATMSTSALVVHAKVNNPEIPIMGLMSRQCSSTSTFPMPSVV